MDPAMFSVASMFGSDSGDEEDDAFVERDHSFPGLVLRVREFAFHQVNANLLWPGATIFAEWILDHREIFSGHRVLELGSGTGALAIFLKKTLRLDITTSDYDDVEIEKNITKNCNLNCVATLPHIRHTWGEDFPYATPDWDLIIASDILLYVKQYPNLIKTLSYLLKGYKEGSERHTKHNPRATDPFTTDIANNYRSRPSLSRSRVPSSDSLGASGDVADGPSGDVADGSSGDANLATEPLTVTSGSCSVDTLNLHSPSPESTDVDGSRSVQGGSLPNPCFLMSWRRRIPKQDESLFFEGCKGAGLLVIDLGSRIYCIHPPV